MSTTTGRVMAQNAELEFDLPIADGIYAVVGDGGSTTVSVLEIA